MIAKAEYETSVIDGKITKYIKSEVGKRQLNRIVSAYVTFENESSYAEARKYMDNK